MLEGFSIVLELQAETFSGLDAVDKCRKLQLPKILNMLYCQNKVCFQVSDETNIRTWFHHSSIRQAYAVKLDWLLAHEIYQDGNHIVLKGDIPEERVWQLAIRAITDQLQNQINHLNVILNATQAELSAALTAQRRAEMEEDVITRTD